MGDQNSLTNEERIKLAVQAEMLMEVFAKKHGLTVTQVIDSVRWYEAHKEWMAAMKRGGALSLIGFLASALLLALWEGLKVLARGR